MHKYIQFATLFLQTFWEKHKKHLIWSGLIGFFATLLFIQIYPLYVEFFGKKVHKIGVIGRFDDRSLPAFIQNQISLGLTSTDIDGKPLPSLATSWETEKEGTVYIFNLVPNISWHDGKKFTSSDVNYKLQGVTFTPLSDYQLKVTLKEAYAPLPVILSQPLFRPYLTGLGMYKVIRLIRSGGMISEMTLQAEEKSFPTLTYKFYQTLGDAILAFKLGEIDILREIPNIQDLKDWQNVKIVEITHYDRFTGLFFNLKDSAFKEKEVRQALAYAIPKFDGVEKAYSPIPPLSWAYSKKIRLYNQDFETAGRILAKSPLSSPSTQITLSTYASLLEKAQMIADAWNKTGIKVKVRVENSLPSDYQIFLLTQVIPADPDQYQYWQSTQEGTNITNYANPKIDKLLEDGRQTQEEDTRKKIYADFQRYLVDDCPVIFLYYPKVYTVERK